MFYHEVRWQMVDHPEKLWVRVFRAKYGCGDSAIPKMKHFQKASHIWRSIQKTWHFIDEGICWVVQDGIKTKFCWILGSLVVESSLIFVLPYFLKRIWICLCLTLLMQMAGSGESSSTISLVLCVR